MLARRFEDPALRALLRRQVELMKQRVGNFNFIMSMQERLLTELEPYAP